MTSKSFNYLPWVFSLLVWVGIAGCSSSHRFVPPPELPDDRTHVPNCPENTDTHILWDGFQRQMVQPGVDLLDFSRWIRKATGSSKEAFNASALDEVVNSSWFTNRNFIEPLRPEEVLAGPNTVDGPDQSQGWTVIRAKTVGVTPGFTIRDTRGDSYVIKLDPPGNNGLNSTTDVIVTKLLYAAGYNVPENYLVTFDPKILKVGEGVKFTGQDGVKRTMTEQDLADILAKVQLTDDGKIQGMASKYIDGKPIGPFLLKGTRPDDPNDIVPHEHRRELRGMRVIFAWLGHYDTNVSNFLDGYTKDDSVNYVRHYLIDFGAALGSHPGGAKPADRGTEPYMDPVHMLNKSLELGLVRRPRDYQEPVVYPEIGRFTSKNFHPKSFKFIFPTRAFEYYTPRDAYWGAKIVASFTESQVRAAVQSANYVDKAAEDYLVNVLMERRDIVCGYWFNRLAPLDHFEMTESGLEFSDLAVSCGLEGAATSSYRFRTCVNGKRTGDWQSIEGSLLIENLSFSQMLSDNDQIALELQVKRERGWSNSVIVYLEKADEVFGIVGIERKS